MDAGTYEAMRARCVRAARENDWRPCGEWSTGEKLLVALVLWDREYLSIERYTYEEAVERCASGYGLVPLELVAYAHSLRMEVERALEDGPADTLDRWMAQREDEW